MLKSRMAKNGVLMVGGVPVDSIVRKAGSPVYIYDAGIMRRQFHRLAKSLAKGFRVFYSIKANPNPTVVKIFRDLGAGAEAASGHELLTAISAGVPRADIAYAGPGKSPAELELAAGKGIGAINVESATELDRIIEAAGRLRKKANVAFRLNLDYSHDDGEGGHIMAGGPRKFGVDPEMVDALVKKTLADKWVKFVGFHLFPGTGILKPQILAGAHATLARFAADFAGRIQTPIKYINFGGGLGVPYKDGEAELDVAAVGKGLREAADILRGSKWFAGARFVMEPGRYLVGPSGVYISTITDVKTSRGKAYVVTDGGIHHALTPIVMNKNFPTALVNRMGEAADTRVRIGGPLCATPDQFSREVDLPSPEIGDLLGIFNAGAYGYTASMLDFLSHPAPAEVLALNGRAYLIRERVEPGAGVCGPKRL